MYFQSCTQDDLIGGGDEEDDNDDEENDFIVDDQGNPIKSKRSKGHMDIEDEQLRDAQEIFGVDFDAAEFENYSEDDDEEDEDEYGEKVSKKRTTKNQTTIYDAFEPDELIEKYYTDYDKFLREVDEPERFLTRTTPVEKVHFIVIKN